MRELYVIVSEADDYHGGTQIWGWHVCPIEAEKIAKTMEQDQEKCECNEGHKTFITIPVTELHIDKLPKVR